jgi:hypothetical protein
MSPTSTVTIQAARRCQPFLIRVMVYSPEAGYKFNIEVQKGCTADNEEIWGLLFSLYKKIDSRFEEIINVEFRPGNPNEIDKVATISEDGLTRSQLRAFRDNVYTVTKPIADAGREPNPSEKKVIAAAVETAVKA